MNGFIFPYKVRTLFSDKTPMYSYVARGLWTELLNKHLFTLFFLLYILTYITPNMEYIINSI